MTPAVEKEKKSPDQEQIGSKKNKKKEADQQAGQTIDAGNAIGSVNVSDAGQLTLTQRFEQKIYTTLSPDELQLKAEKSELRMLEAAIRQKHIDLERLVNQPLPEKGNPFLFMEAFTLRDGSRFFGRDKVCNDLLEYLEENHTSFLEGIGRTSLLQAKVIPELLKQGHLPLLVSTCAESLTVSIKKQLLPNIEGMDFLKKMALPEFVRRVTDHLNGKTLYILIDQFEELDHQPETIREVFKADWTLCVTGIAQNAHWLFAVPAGLKRPLKIFQDIITINTKLVTLQALERGDAIQVIKGQSKLRDIEIDESVLLAILKDLGKPEIEPAQLELVCFMLAGKKGALVKKWSMETYAEKGGADGILSGYLLDTINELELAEREPAWHMLAALDDLPLGASSADELFKKMQDVGVEKVVADTVLQDLREKHLVEYAAAYKLSSKSLHPRIEEWRNKRAALEQAKEELWKQTRNIGGSALRGLIGGALGFMLAYWVLPYVERDAFNDSQFFVWYIFLLLLRALIGAMAGFLMILGLDLSRASLKGKRLGLAWLASGLSGACSLALY